MTSPQEQATELSFDIAARETVVEYLTASSIQASTDWVLSMPTRPYHAAVDYRGPTLVTNRITFGDATAVYFTALGTSVSASGQSCYFALAVNLIEGFDREGRGTTLNIMPTTPTFCGMVSVLSVNGQVSASSPTMYASITRTRLPQPDPDTDGVARLIWQSLEGMKGLPVLVRQFSRAVNPEVAPGVSGTFGATWPGRTVIPGVLP